MAQSRFRPYRVWMVAALLVAGMLTGLSSHPAGADVTAVNGSAYGYSLNVTLFNQAQTPVGPLPTVALPAGGSATPVANSAPTGSAGAGPARFFTSGQIDVSTQGTTGPSGSVTSSATINNITNSSGGQLVATSLASSCTASESGATGTTTITGGTFETDSGDAASDPGDPIPDHAPVVQTLPTNPTVNQTYEGHIHVNGATDNFRVVFNEQIANPDGSITVNAFHQYLLGPTATGDLILGQVVCGVTATGSTTTTAAPGGATTTTAGAGGATTTTAAQTPTTAGPTPTTAAQTPISAPRNPVTAQQTNTTAATTNTTAAAAAAEVGGGAYGFFVSIGLFGGAPATRGPAPTVTLPSGGSATPVTESAPSGNAQFGPAIIFTSDKLDVSTQGTPGGTVTSSATVNNVNRSGQEQLTAATVSSKCTSSGTEHTGSTTITGGSLRTSEGNPDLDADDTVVQLSADPAPNTPYEGKVEAVGDSFRVVLNEQVKTAGGITVNAVHMYLLGPTAVGELIIGQSRCGTTGGGAGGAGGGGGGGAGGGGAGGGGGLPGTGNQATVFVALALVLIMGGWTAMFWTVGAGGQGRRAILASLPHGASQPPRRILR